MAITHYSKFNIFKDSIHTLSWPLHDKELVPETFLLEKSTDNKLSVYYSPVEYLNEAATILIVGITPGFRQMKKAYTSVRENISLHPDEEILRKAKMASSYEGPMRKNLIQMLDQLGLHKHLNIETSEELFGNKNHLVHTTGLLPYPVFYNGRNYTGSTPNIWKTPILKNYVTACFLDDISRLHRPLIIPLGVNVAKVLQRLADLKMLADTHVLFGFPHPSGANGHRNKQFHANKERMQYMIADYFREDLCK